MCVTSYAVEEGERQIVRFAYKACTGSFSYFKHAKS